VSPTPRAALVAVAVAVAGLWSPPALTFALLAGLAVAAAVDALGARARPVVRRDAPRVVARGVAAAVTVTVDGRDAARVQLRQARPPDLVVDPAAGRGRLDGRLVATRRGRHVLAPVAARRTGRLGLAAATFRAAGEHELVAYPDVVAARRLVVALRRGRFRDPGRRSRGPLGLGTDFESIRDYLPDDDVRQINWRATARLGRPMSNQYRVEQDRDVTCVVDAGRLMTAPIGALTRLDAAVDAVTAVALVADEVGDRCGVVVFDAEVRRRVRPRRAGGRAVVQAVLDVEPRAHDSDYALAFRQVGGAKRGLVLVLTDLVDQAAARSLVDAIPVLARRHAVVVASATDPDLERAVTRDPVVARDVYAAAVALDVLGARAEAVRALRRAGAVVVEAPHDALGEACVRAYLSLKARARL
jgi:uncharacterized protein (DUF58 family)